jgi:hypothetical protein
LKNKGRRGRRPYFLRVGARDESGGFLAVRGSTGKAQSSIVGGRLDGGACAPSLRVRAFEHHGILRGWWRRRSRPVLVKLAPRP